MPAAETHTNPLIGVTARAAMRPGLIGVRPDALLREVATAMVVHQVHAVVVGDAAVVSDLALVRAAVADGAESVQAGPLAGDHLPVVAAEAGLDEVAAVMATSRTAHVLVNDDSGVPAGMLSTLDIVAILGADAPTAARGVRPSPARPALSDPRLDRALVRERMHPGVVTCAPATPLGVVAATMAHRRLHAMVVLGLQPAGASDVLLWGVLESLDLAGAARTWNSAREAGDLTRRDPVVIDDSDTMLEAARLMDRHDASHLIVADRSGRPSGMLSTLDVAGVLASDG
jgi:CBS domain-containing protein